MEWMLLPLRRYAQFSGRSRRKEFWMWVLFVIVVSIVLSFVDKALGLGGAAQYGARELNGEFASGFSYGAALRGGLLTNIFALAILVPNIAVAVRRLHDIDRSGWWILLPLAPYVLGFLFLFMQSFVLGAVLAFLGLVAAIVLLVWYCMKGTNGPNRFGPDPLGGEPRELAQHFE